MKKNNGIICNMCGKTISVVNGIAMEDYIHVKKEWGYFSSKDGTTQQFVICEKCSDRLTGGFLVPPNEAETAELL